MRVECFFNLTRKRFSLRQRGKVITHCDEVVILYPTFVVQEAGRQRVIREKRKYVHAFVRGLWIISGTREMEQVNQLTAGATWRRARYNPYQTATFVDAETGEPVRVATVARLTIIDKKAVLEYTLI
jgi:hypothetical protein